MLSNLHHNESRKFPVDNKYYPKYYRDSQYNLFKILQRSRLTGTVYNFVPNSANIHTMAPGRPENHSNLF